MFLWARLRGILFEYLTGMKTLSGEVTLSKLLFVPFWKKIYPKKETICSPWGVMKHCFRQLVKQLLVLLTLKAPITTAADDNFLFSFYFSNLFLFFRDNKYWHFMWIVCQAETCESSAKQKTSLDISCESSAAWQTIHMKCQDLFSLKKQTIHMKCQDLISLKNENKFDCRLLQIFLTL